jgi:16S rRNA (uracil1498-N3)-methyltransferase
MAAGQNKQRDLKKSVKRLTSKMVFIYTDASEDYLEYNRQTMRSPRIYHSQPLALQTEISLEEEAASHVGRVLRMCAGDQIQLFNGDGGQYQAIIIQASKKNVTVKITAFDSFCCESPLRIHLGQGISRGDKMEFTIQKAVELGVSEITPLFTERCGVKLSGDRLDKKWQQWRKIVISACEQSGRNTLPVVHKPVALHEWLQQSSEELKINLHPRATATIKTLAPTDLLPISLSPINRGIRLIIGPEGGLSDNEIEQTVQQGFTEIALGPRILRTETAGLTVISALQLQFGDLA